MTSIFKFKHFEVDQRGCAMKINTDGVLLGAMAESTLPQKILDIGTGTGVIALMLAQRFPNAQIKGIEIDDSAANTAAVNFKNSVFNDRLTIKHTAIETFVCSAQYDLIVSNPPYFVNDLKNTDHKKGIARHTDERFFDDLLAKVNVLLSENGFFWFILPIKQAELLIYKAKIFDLFPIRIIELHSDNSKPPFRLIVCLGKIQTDTKIEHFYIYESEKVYTDSYKTLLEDFFLGY